MPLQLDELFDLLRIESISSDGKHAPELRQAADWVAAMVGGGTVVEGYGNPLVDALIPASVADAPTVVAYGHYDVQAPGDPTLWTSPPFDPQVRDGWLYARGASDDKGNYWALLRAALDLAESGSLGVNVRVIADGEEEVGGHSVIDYLATLDDDFGAAVIFDGGMASGEVPAVTTALRGLVGFQVRLVTNRRELHSGLYGGAAANPVHDLVAVLATVAGHDQDFSAGIAPVTDEERAGWASLPSGAELMQAAGATPADDRAAADFYRRTWEGPSLTVHSIGCGDPRMHKTSIGTEALASLSLRVAPGQDPADPARAAREAAALGLPGARDDRAGRLAAGQPGVRLAGRPRDRQRLRRDRAGHRHAPAGDAQRRLDPGDGRAGVAGHADDPVRLRDVRRRHPLTQREDAGAEPGMGVRSGA